MSINLTKAQRSALASRSDTPLRVVDDQTREEFVIVAGEHYERVQSALAGGPPAMNAQFPMPQAV